MTITKQRRTHDASVQVVDAKKAILGKLAAVVAKKLLEGEKITVVRAEELVISGHEHRNYINFKSYLGKHCNTNHRHGFHHFRAPGKIFRKAVRGMLPRYTKRGEEALARLCVYEGVPAQFAAKKLLTCPRVTQHVLTQSTKFTRVGTLGARFGWKYADVIAAQETKRRAALSVAYESTKRAMKAKATATKKLATELAAVEARYAKFL